jgi:eukaryotic-like serine/threonine-protein kinase
VSRGDPTVPAIGAGTAVADAEAAIHAAGLSPVQAGAAEYSDSVPTGAVVRTAPAAGTPLPPGGSVTLVLSRGQKPVQQQEESPIQVRVPFVIGKTFDEAQEILSDVGLEAEERPGIGGFGRENGRVVNQSNGAGSMVYRGTTIVLETL